MSDAPRSSTSHAGTRTPHATTPAAAHEDVHEVHEGPIRTPKQLIIAVLLSFVVPIAVIVLLATYVTTAVQPAAGSDGLSPEATAARIHPVGSVEVKDANDLASLKNGEQVFSAQCSACHTAGVAGAPKFGDTAAWAARITQGYATLLQSALKGKGAMGPQGGGDFTDLEIGRAVVYMANKGGAQFEDPKPVAAADAASGATETAAAPAAAAAPVTAAAPSASAAATTATTPAATATVAAAPAAATAAVPALYTSVCAVCHAAGVAGAPKVGDKAAWAPRLAQGIDGLTASAIKGKGAMPPKGGAATASDADIKAVVTYFVSAAK